MTDAESSAEGARGSEKLLRRLRPIDDRQIRLLSDLLRRLTIDIDDSFPIGLPRPEMLRATATIKPESLGALADGLVNLTGLQVQRFRMFPKGLPPLERQFVVQFEVTGSPQ